jgi:hypothetical protein
VEAGESGGGAEREREREREREIGTRTRVNELKRTQRNRERERKREGEGGSVHKLEGSKGTRGKEIQREGEREREKGLSYFLRAARQRPRSSSLVKRCVAFGIYRASFHLRLICLVE